MKNEPTRSIVTVFEIGAGVASGVLTLDTSGEARLADGALTLEFPPEGDFDEYAAFEVADPPGEPLDVGWEGAGGLFGRWKKVDGVSRSPVTDHQGEVTIIAARQGAAATSGAATVKIKITKPGKGEPPV
ncbi:MAG: hypothetical protein IPK80_07150 [Nannocystis sp.]|nr:hypothetical protein [Nannocystis sp.]